MGCVIDHLTSHCRVRVLRDFQDTRGTKILAGDTAIIRRMDLDWPTQEIVIEWERSNVTESMFFALAAKEGPRNGHMRDFFEVEGMAVPPRPPPPRLRSVPAQMSSDGGLTLEYDAGLARVHALAAERRFEEADAQMRALLDQPDPHDETLQRLAGAISIIAVAYAADDPVFPWAREWAGCLWHSWGSGATGGGEGAVRAPVIAEAMAALEQHSKSRG